MSTDPICGASVDPQAATKSGLTCTYSGATFCFCSIRCMREFLQLPSLYVVFGASESDEGQFPSSVPIS